MTEDVYPKKKKRRKDRFFAVRRGLKSWEGGGPRKNKRSRTKKDGKPAPDKKEKMNKKTRNEISGVSGDLNFREKSRETAIVVRGVLLGVGETPNKVWEKEKEEIIII